MLPANAWPNYNELEPDKARMNPVQVKMLIFAIRAVDWLLIIALSGYLLYAYQGGSSATYLVTVGIVGLVILHQIGQWTVTKIAYFRQVLKRHEHPPQIR